MASHNKDDDFAGLPAPDVSPLEEEAIRWLVRLTSGEANAALRAEFEQWRAQSPAHEAALVAARQLWAGLEGALHEPAPTPLVHAPERLRVVAPSRARARGRVFALAASLLLCVAVGFGLLGDWRYDYASATGEQLQATLVDGSKIMLNSDSALDVRYSALERRIRLARGEAYFDVAHNPELPFIVKAGDGEVRVLGTAFSARRETDDLLVTVERGRVEVRAAGRDVVLTPNQQVRYDGRALQEVEAVDPHSQLAWRRGRLIIEDQPLAEVLHELDRYHRGMIVVANEAAGSRRLNAVIDLNHIDDWLAALSDSQPIDVKRYGPVTVIR